MRIFSQSAKSEKQGNQRNGKKFRGNHSNKEELKKKHREGIHREKTHQSGHKQTHRHHEMRPFFKKYFAETENSGISKLKDGKFFTNQSFSPTEKVKKKVVFHREFKKYNFQRPRYQENGNDLLLQRLLNLFGINLLRHLNSVEKRRNWQFGNLKRELKPGKPDKNQWENQQDQIEENANLEKAGIQVLSKKEISHIQQEMPSLEALTDQVLKKLETLYGELPETARTIHRQRHKKTGGKFRAGKRRKARRKYRKTKRLRSMNHRQNFVDFEKTLIVPENSPKKQRNLQYEIFEDGFIEEVTEKESMNGKKRQKKESKKEESKAPKGKKKKTKKEVFKVEVEDNEKNGKKPKFENAKNRKDVHSESKTNTVEKKPEKIGKKDSKTVKNSRKEESNKKENIVHTAKTPG